MNRSWLIFDSALPPAIRAALRAEYAEVDRGMLWFILAHALVGTLVLPLIFGASIQGIIGTIILCSLALAAYRMARGSLACRLIMAGVLALHTGQLICISDGLQEMHFHAFVVVAAIAVYKDLRPVWTAVAVDALLHAALAHLQSRAYPLADEPLRFFGDGATWGSLLLHIGFLGLLAGILSVDILVRRRHFFLQSDLRETFAAIVATRTLEHRMKTAGPDADAINAWLAEIESLANRLEEARSRAESANRIRSEFLANISHELRTPLNAILGYAQLLTRDYSLPSEQRARIDIIRRSGEHLLTVINDIIEMSKIEAGRLAAHPAPGDCRAMLEELAEITRHRAAAKHLEFRFPSSPATLPDLVVTDLPKLRRALFNLLDNAVKFTNHGSVTLSASAEPLGDALRLRFTVSDTGPGLSEEDCSRIFRPFVQTAAGACHGGTGLGLAIARHYAELLGGTITADSTPGHGAKFELTIQSRAAARNEPPAATPARTVRRLAPGRPPVRILVADDDAGTRELLDMIFAPKGFEVRLAENGAIAVEIAAAWRPEIILMDIRMPVMDGMEAIRRIRATASGRAAFILAITASIAATDRDPLLAVGADEIIPKPFHPADLLRRIGERLDLHYQYEEDDPPAPPGAPLPAPRAAAPGDELAGLPADTLTALRLACRAADYETLHELLTRLAESHPAQADAWRRLVNAFDYDTLARRLAPPDTP